MYMGCLNCRKKFFVFDISDFVVDFLKKLECQMKNKQTVSGDTDMSNSG